MSGIYIKGMEMPTKGNPIGLLIYPDGTVEWPARDVIGTAVPVPKHGRLIDADALMDSLLVDYPSVVMSINTAPTIIPAEEGGET